MNKKISLGIIAIILLAGTIYALNGPSFIDTEDAEFGNGTLYYTSISGSGADANVTLNFTTINTFKVYDASGNFTSKIFDTNLTNSTFDRIKWSRALPNSTDVAGYAMDTGANDIGIFYKNGTIGADTSQADLATNIDFTGGLIAYTLPAGLSRSDIVGFAWDDDGSGNIFAFFRNGSVASTGAVASLTSDVSFTSTDSYSIPSGLNASSIIGFAVNTGAAEAAVFFRNKSYVQASSEQPPFAFNSFYAYTIPSDFDINNAIGITYDNGASDIAISFRNGSLVSDTSQSSLSADISFNTLIAGTYTTRLNLTVSTNITLQTRVSNNSISFTPWSNLYNNPDGSESIQDNVGRYIQYKAILKTPDKYTAPYLLNVAVNYTFYDLAEPNITLSSPINYFNATYSNINFSFAVTDNVDTELNCSVYIGSTLNLTNSSTLNGTTAFFRIGSLSENSYAWNVTCMDYAGNINASETRNLTVDFTSPIIKVMNFTPNDTDSVDPNVRLNFTINVTDNNSATNNVVGVKAVIFQYRQSGAGAFANITAALDPTDNLYYANFTPNIADTWFYRVYSEDYLRNNDTTETRSISVQSDKTWKILPSAFNNLGCIFSTKCTAGNLTINNTGEFTLNFGLSSNFGDTSFNETEPFDLSAGEYKVIEINLTAGVTASESNVVITIGPTASDAYPGSQTTGFAFTSSAGGPVFDINIISPPTEVNKSYPGEFYLNVSLKNIGNETAGFTWINWTLPANWLNISRTNLTINFSSISVQEIVYHNITVNVTSSASTGTQRVNVTAASNDSASDSAAASIVVTETSTTTTVTTISDSGGGGGGSSGGGGGGGGGGIIKVPVKPEVIEISKIVDLVSGKDNSFKIDVKNTFEGSVMENLKLQVEGFPKQYISIEPKLIPRLYFGEEASFTVSLSAPSYKESEEHTLKATVTGMVVKTSQLESATATSQTPFVLKNFISLFVHKVSREEVDEKLKEAETLIEEMKMSSFPVNKAMKLLEDANQALGERKYNVAADISSQIKSIRDNAILSHSNIEGLKKRVEDAESNGLRAEETKKLINLALAAFEREDFATALKRANDAKLSLILETEGKINPINFMIEYWRQILAGLAALLGVMNLTKKKLILILIARKVDDLEKEQETINGLMAETQRNYFDHKKISGAEYHQSMYNYEKRISDIWQEISRLKSKRKKIIEISNEIRNMEKERQNVKSMIRDIQESYYNKKSVPRSVYMKREKECQIRETEIEKAIAVLETKLAKREKMHSMVAKESTEKNGMKNKNEEIKNMAKKEKNFPVQKIMMLLKKVFGKGHEENKNLPAIDNRRSIMPLNGERLGHIKNEIIGAQNENGIEHHKKIRDGLLESLNIPKTGNAHEEMENPALSEKLNVPIEKSSNKKISGRKQKHADILASIKSRFGLEKIKSEKAPIENYHENKNMAYSRDLSKDRGILEKHGFIVTPRAISKTVAHKDNILRHLKEVHKNG